METLKTYFEQIPVETVKKIAQPLHTTHEPTEEEWRTVARQVSEEEDPDTAMELAQRSYRSTTKRGAGKISH